MPGSVQGIDFAETQKIAANMIASTLCNNGTEAFLDAQADLLRNVQNAVTEWLHRRQEAIDDAFRLVARLRGTRELNEIWNAHQDWATSAIQRFAADLTAYQAMFATAGQRVAHAAADRASNVGQGAGQAARNSAEISPRSASRLPKVPAEPKAETVPAE